MADQITQCVLEATTGAILVTWLPSKQVKSGLFITLESDRKKVWWKIRAIGSTVGVDNVISAHKSGIIHDKDFVRDRQKGGFKKNKKQ